MLDWEGMGYECYRQASEVSQGESNWPEVQSQRARESWQGPSGYHWVGRQNETVPVPPLNPDLSQIMIMCL